MTQTITSLTGFTGKIRAVTPASDEVLLYRGHSRRRDYKLLPFILREQKFKDAEETILRELVASHPSEFSSDSSTLERLARVQHYSLPTRLLDVTWNPLVALYFAVNAHEGTTGEVIVFRIKKQHVKFFDSDAVSCVANLAHLKVAEKSAIDFALTGTAFNSQPPIDRLLQFIKVEKPHFRSEINPADLKTVLCVKPKKNNPRLLAQSGAFLIFGMTDALDTTPVVEISIERIQINGQKKSIIVKELDRMGIHDATMFPEIEKAALYIRRAL